METPNDLGSEMPHEEPTASIYDQAKESVSKLWSGLQLRIISALVMATVSLFALLAGGVWFILFVLLLSVQMVREWDLLTEGQGEKWQHLAYVYVAVPAGSLIWLRGLHLPQNEHAGMQLVLFVVLVVCVADIGAYFTGKQIGGPKLAPQISPGKTWAGLVGGVVAAALAAAFCASFTPYPYTFSACIMMGVVLAFVSQAGDLFESWIKRRAGVKDSGTILPGHGGVLDRLDGIIFAAPVFALMVFLGSKFS